MAENETTGKVSCIVVLHDDETSLEDVLCGDKVLPSGAIGRLVSPEAQSLVIKRQHAAPNDHEVSLHVSIAKVFGFKNRMKAEVVAIHDPGSAIATHVELSFRDQYLSRADMWEMRNELDSSVLYETQRLKYLGSTTATVEAIYISGIRVRSAFVSHPQTKLIFRSASARFTILIQVSKEMIEDWSDGDLLYERVVDGYLPELFRRWETLKARHHVSIVLFGRALPVTSYPSHNATHLSGFDDFFHVAAIDAPSDDWRMLRRRLREAFANNKFPSRVSLAAKGNMLEALSIAAMDFVNSNIDQHLACTGTSIIAVSAGAGLFEANYERLKSLTELLLGSSIGVDVVSVSAKPLHPVPLFEYRGTDEIEYALPHWADISFWSSSDNVPGSRWNLPALSYDITNVKVDRLGSNEARSKKGTLEDSMHEFDESTFGSSTTAAASTNGHLIRKTTKSFTPSVASNLDQASAGSEPPAVRSSATTSVTSAVRSMKSSRHPLMETTRKVSLGPKGLAPIPSGASTGISVQYAQQDRERSSAAVFPGDDTTSGLTRQIQDSLKRKPSHQSLASRVDSDSAQLSLPIDIHGAANQPVSERAAATVYEEGVPNAATAKGVSERTNLSASSLPDRAGSMSPWLTLLNPCNPRRDNMYISREYRQWQSVFPLAVTPDIFKWDSMCSPAALPLVTEYWPTKPDLEKRYSKTITHIEITPNERRGAMPQVMEQMLKMRLNAGFQICSMESEIGPTHGERMLLSRAPHYHEISRHPEAGIQIIEYVPKQESAQELERTKRKGNVIEYSAKLKSTLTWKAQALTLKWPQTESPINWTHLDEDCANGTGSRLTGTCRIRLVLIPTGRLHSETQGLSSARELSDEELRLEGIQKLTQTWQRHRFVSEEDQKHQASMVKARSSGSIERDPNPLAIEYVTRDVSAVVGAYGMNLIDPADSDRVSRLFSESEHFHTSKFDLAKLVKQMQEPNGVALRDRRWLTRLHLNCFRGDEMTNWLLRVFKDLSTREDAVVLGDQLMERGVFSHVRGKHGFLDGNYFYQIKAAHRTTEYPDTAGFFGRPVGSSVPSTPIADPKRSPADQSAHGDSDTSNKPTSTPSVVPTDNKEKKEVLLSQRLQFNVDSARRSNEVAFVNVHYDRIHNPENCYHIQLDWNTTTPKLVRESIGRWASSIESHGIHLVQLPLKEASKLHEQHPFDQSLPIRLATRPRQRNPETPQLDAQMSSPQSTDDLDGFHKAVLRKMDFVLDFESARCFPRTVDVTYSWGRPDYQYTQFIHRSGTVLAQIVNKNEMDFLLLPNRLATSLALSSNKRTATPSVESVVQKFDAYCRDEKALNALMDDFTLPRVTVASPFASALDTNRDIPPIELPPGLSHRSLLKNTG